MFFKFNKPKLTIDSVQIPNFNWDLEDNTQEKKMWYNPAYPMALSLNFFAIEPDIPSIQNIEIIRQYYRAAIAQAGGGLVEVELEKLNGIDSIKTIFKIPQQPTGMSYLASYTIPFKKYSYVIKIQAQEAGMTGMRDNIIANQLMQEGIISVDETGYTGWFEDPYDPNFEGGAGVLMNKSEATQYDEMFPEHPLSQCRKLMKEIAAQIQFKKEIGKAAKFPS